VHLHTATCPTALDLASQLRWAPVRSRALWLRTLPPDRGVLQPCHVSYGSEPHLSKEVDSDTTTCYMALNLTSRMRCAPVLTRVLWLQTLPPDRSGLRRCQVSYGSGPHLPVEMGSGTATYPAVPCGPWTSSIKKSLVALPVQLDTHVSNARTQISKVPDRAGKTCG
jgi:hypothetical protein